MVGQWNHLCNLKAVAALLLFYMAFISCAPLSESAECMLDKTILVELGFEYLRDTANDVYPELNNETLSTNFTESVCPLFEEYSRLAVTLDNHFDKDSLHTNLTLLVLISEKVLMDSCEFAKDANSPLNCSSISSISQYCLYSHSVDQLDANIEHYMKVLKKDPSFNINLDSHPACWLTQLFSNGLPEDSVVNTLLNILRRSAVNCSINECDGSVQCS